MQMYQKEMSIIMGMSDFFQKMYGKYFIELTDEQRDAYLARIGLEGANIPLSKEGLDMLQWAHLTHVPFENLDLFDYNAKIDFDVETMYDKVVARNRGGYCFELNSIFYSLIKACGFEAHPIGVRITMGGESAYLPAIAHRGTIVTIDGKRYFSDVGFGMTNAPAVTICIDEEGEQDIKGETYHVEDRPYNNKIIMRHTENGPMPLFIFLPDPFNVLDFITYNTTMQATGFRAKRIANLRTEEGAISVDGDIFRKISGEEREESPIANKEEAFAILTDVFGMKLTEPLGDIAVAQQQPF